MSKALLAILLIFIGILGFVFVFFGFSSLSDDKWVHLVSLTAILSYLLLALFRKDLNVSDSLKYVLIWIGVGLVLIIGYAYRNELGFLSERLRSELNPSSGRITADNEITYAKADDGHYYIDAEVNGVKIQFMVDTGASRVVLTSQDARKIGIITENLDYIQQSSTANGTVWSAPVTLDSIRLNNMVVQNIPASVSQSDLDTSLLGMSFLDKLKGYRVDSGGLTLIY